MQEPKPSQPGTSTGENSAEDLIEVAYSNLRDLAERLLEREGRGHTLQPTALVHEAYLRLAANDRMRWQGRTHFCAVAAQAMRRILVDHARRRLAAKRGGAWERVSLCEGNAVDARTPLADVDLIDLDAALDRLTRLNERHGRIVELRFLAGLTIDETAETLGVGSRTVQLDWRMARAWLVNELGEH